MITGEFKVIDVYGTRGGSRVVLEHVETGEEYTMFGSEFAKLLEKHSPITPKITIEVKYKGTARGWGLAKDTIGV